MANRLAIALIATGLLASPGAFAATPTATSDILIRGTPAVDGARVQRVVPYSDVSLRSEAGRRELMSRLSFAIDSLCDESVSAATDPVGALKCNNAAWAEAQAQLSRMTLASR